MSNDNRFKLANKLYLPSSMQGKYGDVRDIILFTKNNEEIGFSIKNRHKAVKHSRLSANIDFGKEWLGIPLFKNLFQRNNTNF